MSAPVLTLNVIFTPLARCRLGAGQAVPHSAWDGEFCSVIRGGEGLELVCDEARAPGQLRRGGSWRALRLERSVGISMQLAWDALVRVLGAAVRGLTVDQDVLLVEGDRLTDALVALERAGFAVEL